MSPHTRRLGLLALALVGIVTGIAAGALVGGSDEGAGAGAGAEVEVDGGRPTLATTVTPATTSSAGRPTAGQPTTTALSPRGPLLVWTTGGLPAGFDAAVSGLPAVTEWTLVRGDDVELTGSWDQAGAAVDEVESGWFIPLDALAIDAASYARVVPGSDELVAALDASDSAVLGVTSAKLRRVGVGGRIAIAGAHELTVTAIVADELVAGAELVVSSETGTAIGVTTPRSMLLRYTGDRASLETAISQHRGSRSIRIREGAETTYLRHGDAVLPQSLIKERFGEFSARHADGPWLELDPAWVDDNITEVDLPVLGPTLCHEDIAPVVERALDELADEGLTSLVDPSSFGGCFAPRLIGPGLGVSRHAWGVAIDVNVAGNPLGGSSTQDPRLVEVMRRAGMAWGGEWLRPDPMHFEYLTPPR
jgi:hypothetical protein